jgi:hypothetical protein
MGSLPHGAPTFGGASLTQAENAVHLLAASFQHLVPVRLHR